MKYTFFCSSLAVLLLSGSFLTGCAEVKPWQKGNLARPHMAFEPSPAEARFSRHVEDSKEGSSGGYGVGGGGCGCN